MINFAKFEVIGNVGAIQASGNVTHLKIASNFRRKNGEEWVDDTNWNRVTIFNERYRKTIAERLRVGDLIFAEGMRARFRGGTPCLTRVTDGTSTSSGVDAGSAV